MKRYVVTSLIAFAIAASPCHAQLLQKLQQNLLGGQGQGQAPQQGLLPGQQQGLLPGLIPGVQQQNSIIGNVNLPPGQYLMSNVQTGQAFYVNVQNGQMSLAPQPSSPQFTGFGQNMMPQQNTNGVGGLIRSGLGSFLKNQLTPQEVPPQQ